MATRLGGLPKFLLPAEPGLSMLARHVASVPDDVDVAVPTTPELEPLVHRLLGNRAQIIPVQTETMAETVSLVLANSAAESIAIGLPDTLTFPRVTYSAMLVSLSDAEVSVAAFRTREDQVGKLGALILDGDRVTDVIDKQPTHRSAYHWGAVAFRRDVLEAHLDIAAPHVGYALSAACQHGRDVQVVQFGDKYFDCGTFDELLLAYGHLANRCKPGREL
jgi:hypothetical protein